MTIQGVIHGKTIELDRESGLPSGQLVSVDIRPVVMANTAKASPLPEWLARLDIDPVVRAGKFVIKGTKLLVDDLVQDLQAGRTERELLQAHPELGPDDVTALCEYAKLTVEMRRCFGAWADEAEELDKYLDWARQHRQVSRRRIVQ